MAKRRPYHNRPYELTIVGDGNTEKRRFVNFEDAKEAALRILAIYDSEGTRAAHRAIIYGPDCGPDGKTIV